MRALALARALHVLAVILWIGGVAMVTMVLLPAIRSLPLSKDPFAFFEWIERRFAFHARILTVVAGASGFYMLHETGGWSRYLSPASWWLHAMTLAWVLFTILLFVLEPLVLHRKLVRAIRKCDSEEGAGLQILDPGIRRTTRRRVWPASPPPLGSCSSSPTASPTTTNSTRDGTAWKTCDGRSSKRGAWECGRSA